LAGCGSSTSHPPAAGTTSPAPAPATTTTTTPAAGPPTAAGTATAVPPTTPKAPPPPTAPPTAPTKAEAGALGGPAVPGRALPRDDRSRYTLTVTIDPDASRATGTMSVRFTPDLATDRVVLRLWPNSPTLAAAGAHLDLGQITIDGHPVTTSQPNS